MWKRNGPMFSFSDGWSEDQNHGKDKVGSVVSLDETMQLPWQEKILTKNASTLPEPADTS